MFDINITMSEVHDMQARTTSKQELSRIPTQRNTRKLDVAEARHKIELLQEARLLQEHLAEFWELPDDKHWRKRFSNKQAMRVNSRYC
jgi:hypothetical protein